MVESSKADQNNDDCSKISRNLIKIRQNEFDSFFQSCIIKHSILLVVVKKKYDSIRPCDNFGWLTEAIKPGKYPLPRISDIPEKMASSKVFSSMNLEVFYKIPILPSDTHKTAIITSFGLFEFFQIPFGLCHAVKMFNRYMDSLLNEIQSVATADIGDIIVHSKDLEEPNEKHIQRIQEKVKNAYSVDQVSKTGICCSPFKNHIMSKRYEGSSEPWPLING